MPTTLTVYAAASLTDAFAALGRALEAQRPGLTVRFNFAGSQQLALQLQQGAPADVFASADQRWMRSASEHGLVQGTPTVFARNRLVVLLPRANPGRIARLEDLARPGIKLVLAAEAVPAGRYSREMLHNLAREPGYTADYDRRVLANVVSEEENVRGVVAKVQLGEADAGVVYGTDVTPAVGRATVTLEVPATSNVLAEYPLAVLRSARNPAAARAFINLVASDAGQRILRQHGFLAATDGRPATSRP